MSKLNLCSVVMSSHSQHNYQNVTGLKWLLLIKVWLKLWDNSVVPNVVLCVQVVFWGTLALMVVCYTFISKKVYESYKASKSRSHAASRKTKAKVFVVVGVFFICFAPFHFARIPYTLTQTGSLVSHCRAQNALYIAKETTLWLSATNVCLDPLIYVFLCKVFRKKLTATFCCKLVNKGAMETSTATSSQLEMSQKVQSSRLPFNGISQE